MSTSKTEDTLDVVQTVPPTSRVLELVKEAAQDVRAEAERAQTKPLSKVEWTGRCEEVTKQYFGDHYHKISRESDINKILNPSSIDKYYKPEVFVFLEGVFRLGLGSDHAGVAICLFQEGDLQTKAEDPRGRSVEVVWKQGSIIYLAGDTTFKTSGEGRIVCIFLGFGKK